MTDLNIEVTCDKFLTPQYGDFRKHLPSVIKLDGLVWEKKELCRLGVLYIFIESSVTNCHLLTFTFCNHIIGKNDNMPHRGWVKATELCVVAVFPEGAVREAKNTFPDVVLPRPWTEIDKDVIWDGWYQATSDVRFIKVRIYRTQKLSYRIYSNKRRGAYLIFRAISAAVI